MILLDTHALVWLDQGNERLGDQARVQIDTALQDDRLAVCAISFWELGMLQAKQRIELPPLLPWRRELLGAGLREIPVDGELGLLANDLANFHPDSADRLIVAAGLIHDAALVTADQRILGWSGALRVIDAEK